MHIHFFQHVPFEDPALILDWAKEKNHTLTGTRFYLNDWEKPSIDTIEWLIVMGGPMSVGDSKRYPWLSDEKKLIEQVIGTGKIVIGICLGAQLIAEVLGARVYKNRFKEIGWFQVTPGAGSENRPPVLNLFTEPFTAFHWHGDTFDIPAGAIHIMKSEGCEHQAFCMQDRVFSFQFHLESTQESVQKLVLNCREDMTKGPFVQREDDVINNTIHFQQMHRLLRTFLDSLSTSAKS